MLYNNRVAKMFDNSIFYLKILLGINVFQEQSKDQCYNLLIELVITPIGSLYYVPLICLYHSVDLSS